MLSKSLIQFSVGGQGCVPSLLFTWGQTRVEVMKIMVTFFKRSQAPSPAAGRRRPTPLLETPGHSQASLGQSPVGSLLLSLGLGEHKVLFVPSKSLFPQVLCKFWWLFCGVIGNLLQEVLCYTQDCCTQSPCPCSRPLLTHTSTRDAQTLFWLSLCGSLGPGAHKVCLSPLSVSGG